MANLSILWKPYLRSLDNQCGFTILELMVAAFIGLFVLFLSVGIIVSNRNLYQYDLVRTRLNQNLRSSLEVIGVNVREAGENLPAAFPAVELADGSGFGGSDELTVRRNLLDEVLKLCQQIDEGTGDTDIFSGIPGTVPGCIYADNQSTFATWQAHRTQNGGEVPAFIYDSVAGEGEFFNYISEVDDGSALMIQRSDGTWEHSYNVNSASIYMLEEWHFRLVEAGAGDVMLQVVENDNLQLNVVYGVDDFQLQATMSDDSVKDELEDTDLWTDIKKIQVTIAGSDTALKRTINKTLSAGFFPRNILSN